VPDNLTFNETSRFSPHMDILGQITINNLKELHGTVYVGLSQVI